MTDTILTGGVFWLGSGSTQGGSKPVTAAAIAEGRVKAVGSDEEIESVAGPKATRIDLAGRRVVPGFIDAHTHFIDGGFELAGIQLRDVATKSDFVKRVGDFVAKHREEWVLGGSWDHQAWGGDLPTRHWIDAVSADTPVLINRFDIHMALANSKALELAGVTETTADPSGGTIVRDSDGLPTGILKDAALKLVHRVIPDRSESALNGALQAAAGHALERGVTMVGDMGDWEGLETYRRAQECGELPLRVYAVVQMNGRERMAEFVRKHSGRGDHRLFWGGVKAFVDGSLGSTTAWFHDPYVDEPDTVGLIVSDPEELKSAIIEADAAELQVIVHAIGDKANDWLLDAYARADEVNGPRDRRFRIEHAQHLTKSAVARFSAAKVIPSMQPYHATDDGSWADRRLGPDRIKGSYVFRDLLDSGATLAFGSDWTVAPLDPILGIHAAVTRRTQDGQNPNGWLPEQKITVEEAVTAFTAGAAYACFMDNHVGTIEPGKYADLVVLSHDIFEIESGRIDEARVDMTMVEGEVVYSRE